MRFTAGLKLKVGQTVLTRDSKKIEIKEIKVIPEAPALQRVALALGFGSKRWIWIVDTKGINYTHRDIVKVV